ncbi:segregation/condensation protein A [Streptomyces sp. T-3]|nr:segregation/condensation protein A [Streptomyces sp. T-3]
MPTHDSSDAPQPRRRSLGRGPGAGPSPVRDEVSSSPAPPLPAESDSGSATGGGEPRDPRRREAGPQSRRVESEEVPEPREPDGPSAVPEERAETAERPAAPDESDVVRRIAGSDVSQVSAESGVAQALVGSGVAQVSAESGGSQVPDESDVARTVVESGEARAPVEPGEVRATAAPGEAPAPVEPDDGRFKVRLVNFEGPFDLLLQLISKHKLDVTEVALSMVTNEFMAHIRAMGPDWDLDQTTEFLVVAATLLDLKAARLLPSAEVEDEADLALLEARDLLFARLLQYRAYKQIADIFSRRLDEEARRYPRTVGLEPHHAELLPEVVISIGAEGFAKLAVKAMQPKPKPQVYVDHIHAPLVSVREQGEIVIGRLREVGEASFQVLVEDAPDTLTVVARFLALLELYREKAVALDQDEALGELMVRWTGGEGAESLVTDEFDRPPDIPDDKDGKGDKGNVDQGVVEESV